MSFGGGFGGFGQNSNNAQPSAFGGFGSNTNNATGTVDLFSPILHDAGTLHASLLFSFKTYWSANLDHQDSARPQPAAPLAAPTPTPVLDSSAAARLRVALEQTQAARSVRPTTRLARHQHSARRPPPAVAEVCSDHQPRRPPGIQALVVSVLRIRQAPQHLLVEAVHRSSVAPSLPPPLGPPRHLPLVVPFLVVAAQVARLEARQAQPLARRLTQA